MTSPPTPPLFAINRSAMLPSFHLPHRVRLTHDPNQRTSQQTRPGETTWSGSSGSGSSRSSGTSQTFVRQANVFPRPHFLQIYLEIARFAPTNPIAWTNHPPSPSSGQYANVCSLGAFRGTRWCVKSTNWFVWNQEGEPIDFAHDASTSPRVTDPRARSQTSSPTHALEAKPRQPVSSADLRPIPKT